MMECCFDEECEGLVDLFANSIPDYLFYCVRKNDVYPLTKYLESKEWYKVRDGKGNTLLQAAIHPYRKEVFDYILSLDNFPLENDNDEEYTALEMALGPQYGDDKFVDYEQYEYFALELIKKGAELHESAILDAVILSFVKAIELLLEKGADPNLPKAQGGETCLHRVNYLHDDAAEMYFLLLIYGADPFLEGDNGEIAFLLMMGERPEISHILIDLVIDEYSSLKMSLRNFVNLEDSPYFLRITSHIEEIFVRDMIEAPFSSSFAKKGLGGCQWFLSLFVLMFSEKIAEFIPFTVNNQLSIETLSSFVEDNLGCNFPDLVVAISSNNFFKHFLSLGVKESTATGIISYLLSQGLTFNQFDLQMVYKKFGYCHLFKMMLHMDFDMYYNCDKIRFIDDDDDEDDDDTKFVAMPMFIYIHDLDIDTYLKAPKEYSDYKIEELLHYFVHPKLTQYCEESPDEEVQVKVKKFPKVPRLKQLSRDMFRKFLIKKYDLITARQFYTFVENFPISNVYKRIVTYEMKLY